MMPQTQADHAEWVPARRRSRRRAGRPGYANINANVPALPTHNTLIRAAPSAASSSTMTETRASRAMVATPNHSGHRPVHDDGDDRGADQDPVGGRIEDLAEGRDLVVAAGHVAVDPVGGAEDGQQHGGGGLAVQPEEQPQEQRDAQQPDQRDDVGSGQDPAQTLFFVHAPQSTGAARPDRAIAPSHPRMGPFARSRVPEWRRAAIRTVPRPALRAAGGADRPGHGPALRRHQLGRAGTPGLTPPGQRRPGRAARTRPPGRPRPLPGGRRPLHPLAGRRDPAPRPAPVPLPLPDDRHRRGGLDRGDRRPRVWPSPARRATSCPTSRRCPSPRATGSTCSGPPGPTSRRSGGCR